jgi:hypothetical protein
MGTKPMNDNTPEDKKSSTDETAQTQNDAIAADGGRPIRHHVDEVVLAVDSHNPLLHLHAPDDAADDATPRCGGAPGASRNGNTTRYRSADVASFPPGYREWCDDCVSAFYDAGDGETPSGQDVKEEAETMLREQVNHGRLYPNLDTLVEAGLVEKGSIDRRTNSYELTSNARAMVRERVHRLASAFDVEPAMADGGESR